MDAFMDKLAERRDAQAAEQAAAAEAQAELAAAGLETDDDEDLLAA